MSREGDISVLKITEEGGGWGEEGKEGEGKEQVRKERGRGRGRGGQIGERDGDGSLYKP